MAKEPRKVAVTVTGEKRATAAKRRLSREDWIAAGLAALADGGVAAVAIEPLATGLGATKGSAYWHFPNREALLTAVLDRWRVEQTEQVIDLVEGAGGPIEKLRALFDHVMRTGAGVSVTLRLQAAVDLPVVAEVVDQVNRRRIDYMADLIGHLGLSTARARRRALIVYAAYLGQVQLMSSSPGEIPRTKAARDAYVDELLAVLAGAGEELPSRSRPAR